jgi:hypothetical protein
MTDEPDTTSDDYWTICPYCGEKHGDGWEWNTTEDGVETICQECNRGFLACASYSVTFYGVPIAIETNEASE